MDQTEKTAASHSPALKDTDLAETPTRPLETDDDTKIRKQLLSRIAVAGVVILGLLGGLAIFEVLNRPQESALPKMAAVPQDQPTAIEASKPTTEAVAEEQKERQVAPEEKEMKVAEKTVEVAETSNAAQPLVKPLTKPATHHTASIKPASPASTLAQPEMRKEIAKPIPEHTTALTTPVSKAVAPANNVAPKIAPAPAQNQMAHVAPAVATPKTSARESGSLAQVVESAKRYLVQLGVFNTLGNAEDLIAKLQAAGLPAQIESRVQVGPFATRAEADAARTKLKAMGYDDGLLVRR
jgi:DedD protein